MLELARAIGILVPPIRLVPVADIEALPGGCCARQVPHDMLKIIDARLPTRFLEQLK